MIDDLQYIFDIDRSTKGDELFCKNIIIINKRSKSMRFFWSIEYSDDVHLSTSGLF